MRHVLKYVAGTKERPAERGGLYDDDRVLASVRVNREVGSISQYFRHPGRGQPTLRQLFWAAQGCRDRLSVRMWEPVLDMDETKDDLVLNFELPGVREK